jgi:hypothetical protein
LAWCRYLEARARRLYAMVRARVRVAAALLASRMARGRQHSFRFNGTEVKVNLDALPGAAMSAPVDAAAGTVSFESH